MPTATTDLDIDLAELLGPLLVAEVEAYLATVAPTPAWRARLRTAIAEAHTSTPRGTSPKAPKPWWHDAPAPVHTLTDRILRRRPTVPVTARQYLHLMDRYIRQHGWTQGRLWDDTGAVCVLGAHIQVLAAGYGTPATAWQARLLIGNALGYQGTPVPVDTWNDLPTTCQNDVHHLLRAAAARA
ncbi:hypothetical protein AB0D10_05220 [Kitasatospora sp. NPDC048545]|uniref:DUF6197 family protein n=1 Tax=Kitasatospora sp. NPDC048545 TaxID=3157208 RepID=UPI0033FFBDE5